MNQKGGGLSDGYSKQVCITVTFWYTTPWSLLNGDRLLDGSVSSIKMEKNEMGGTCSAYGVEDRNIQGFGGET